MTIPYRIAKFKSANILAIAILGSTAKFNSRQYFQLYGNNNYSRSKSFEPCAQFQTDIDSLSLSSLPSSRSIAPSWQT